MLESKETGTLDKKLSLHNLSSLGLRAGTSLKAMINLTCQDCGKTFKGNNHYAEGIARKFCAGCLYKKYKSQNDTNPKQGSWGSPSVNDFFKHECRVCGKKLSLREGDYCQECRQNEKFNPFK